MRELLARHAHETAAVIVEPLVQCAGDMRMYAPAYLTQLRKACDEHGVHLIADEIAVGFGRTGTLFACEQAGITPDFLCLSKGLTGGYLPLSAVLTTARVYDAFYDEYAKLNAFLHSHSYTGNALACAAARATLGIFPVEPGDRAQPRAGRAHGDRRRGAGRASACGRGAPARHDPRHRDGEGQGAGARPTISASGAACGCTATRWNTVRCCDRWATCVYFMPPYVIAPEEIDLLAAVAAAAIEAATCD